MTAAAPPPLAPDLVAEPRRLKLPTMRRLAPELLITAKTQCAPEEPLRTLVKAEITAREGLTSWSSTPIIRSRQITAG